MRRSALLQTAAASTLALAASSSAAAETPSAGSGGEPLGIALEGYPYPYPVRFFNTTVGGRDARIAYMDVSPSVPYVDVAFLVHGRNFPSSYWAEVMAHLLARGYRVIAADQFGFNKSSKIPDVEQSLDVYVETTNALFASLALERVTLVAHSIGTLVASAFAARHGGRLRRLLLIDPLSLEDYRILVPEVTDRFLYERELATTVDEYRTFLQTNYFPAWRPEYEQFVDVRARMMGSADYPTWVRVYVPSYQIIHRTVLAPIVAAIQTPTRIIVGELDFNAPGKPYAPQAVRSRLGHNAELAQIAAGRMSNGRAFVMPGMGHVPFIQDFRAFAAVFDAALAETA